uniref:Uncharacterized protein n=1 Tax=Spironucleus salmonicida TaxID=348837 RepID=V6M134_9EUKA|eukprot:EST46879.1 Hypothetical protein SS50377_13031 [Spironucleus salmonicida]
MYDTTFSKSPDICIHFAPVLEGASTRPKDQINITIGNLTDYSHILFERFQPKLSCNDKEPRILAVLQTVQYQILTILQFDQYNAYWGCPSLAQQAYSVDAQPYLQAYVNLHHSQIDVRLQIRRLFPTDHLLFSHFDQQKPILHSNLLQLCVSGRLPEDIQKLENWYCNRCVVRPFRWSVNTFVKFLQKSHLPVATHLNVLVFVPTNHHSGVLLLWRKYSSADPSGKLRTLLLIIDFHHNISYIPDYQW